MLFKQLPLIWRWFAVNVFPGLAVTAVLLVVACVAAEGWLRLNRPFVRNEWNSRFDSQLGFVFVPGSTIRQTNHLEFWGENRANSLGFLDREPPLPGAHRDCRIAFFGDSFVEAVQVPIEKKFHVLLEKSWNTISKQSRIETMAFGYSGTGQANQLPWFDLAEPYRPDVIVLVFVSNDFANNNVWLEAARNGWHPFHPPRPFFVRDKTGYRYLSPDPQWQSFLILDQSAITQKTKRVADWLHSKLYEKSYAYTALYQLWQLKTKRPADWYANLVTVVAALRALPGGDARFGDWNPPDDLTIDQMFYAKELPEGFSEAVEDTKVALQAWQQKARQANAELLILATHSLEYTGDRIDPRYAERRQVVASRQLERLEQLAKELNIPVIDQAAYIRATGGQISQASYRYDGHWNEYGHRSAAEALQKYLAAHPEVCKK